MKSCVMLEFHILLLNSASNIGFPKEKGSTSLPICRKYEGGPFRLPAMAPWPRERVSKATPFTYTGLDYLGPLYIKEKAETSKVWIC